MDKLSSLLETIEDLEYVRKIAPRRNLVLPTIDGQEVQLDTDTAFKAVIDSLRKSADKLAQSN